MKKYSIKKSSGIGYEYNEITKVWINDEGKLRYKMIVPDHDVESVLLKAQKEGGLYITIPYSGNEGDLHILAQKKHFVSSFDEQIFNAVEANLKSGLVEPENISDLKTKNTKI